MLELIGVVHTDTPRVGLHHHMRTLMAGAGIDVTDREGMPVLEAHAATTVREQVQKLLPAVLQSSIESDKRRRRLGIMQLVHGGDTFSPNR